MAARLPRRNHTSNNNLGRGLSLQPMLLGFVGCEKQTNDQAVRVKKFCPRCNSRHVIHIMPRINALGARITLDDLWNPHIDYYHNLG